MQYGERFSVLGLRARIEDLLAPKGRLELDLTRIQLGAHGTVMSRAQARAVISVFGSAELRKRKGRCVPHTHYKNIRRFNVI
jgi:hypothetical protein